MVKRILFLVVWSGSACAMEQLAQRYAVTKTQQEGVEVLTQAISCDPDDEAKKLKSLFVEESWSPTRIVLIKAGVGQEKKVIYCYTLDAYMRKLTEKDGYAVGDLSGTAVLFQSPINNSTIRAFGIYAQKLPTGEVCDVPILEYKALETELHKAAFMQFKKQPYLIEKLSSYAWALVRASFSAPEYVLQTAAQVCGSECEYMLYYLPHKTYGSITSLALAMGYGVEQAKEKK